MRKDSPAAAYQALTQDGMVGVGARLFDASQTIKFGSLASPQVTVLREDEPHPVAALSASFQLRESLFEQAASLSGNEAFEAERIVRQRRYLALADVELALAIRFVRRPWIQLIP